MNEANEVGIEIAKQIYNNLNYSLNMCIDSAPSYETINIIKDSIEKIDDQIDDLEETSCDLNDFNLNIQELHDKSSNIKKRILDYEFSLKSPDQIIKENQIKEYAQTLNLVNYQIAELSRIKEQLEEKLAKQIEHPDEGQKSYTYDKYQITIKTGWIYSLNKSEYEVIGQRLPEVFNPIEVKETYHINKQVIRNAEKYASEQELQLLAQIIEKKPSKLYVKISAAT